MLREGQLLKRIHSDRGILEVDDGRFIKKVPQTSVAPTYKLTLPSEFVAANLSHLIDQSFDLTDKEGKDVWRVALLPRRNKNKYEYTLQGWKAFALSHSVQTGDRLQIELLPDSRRMRADIVKRAALTQRVASDPGPESPALPDMASAAKPQINSAGEPTTSSSEPEHQPGQLPASGASGSSGLSAEQSAKRRQPGAAASGAAATAAAVQHVKFEALQALSGALTHQLQSASARAAQPEDGQQRGLGPAAGGAFNAFAEANRLAEAAEEDKHSDSWRPQRSGVAPRAHDGSEDEQDNMEPYTPTYPRKSKGLGIVTPHHPKRQRTGLLNGLGSYSQADRTWSAGARDLDTACLSGMALLSSAAELDAGAQLSYAHQPETPAEDAAGQAHATAKAQGGVPQAPGPGGGDSAGLLAAAEQVLDAQTSRGFIDVSELLKIAARLVAPALLAGCGEGAAAELAALHADLKAYTNSLLDAMWHMRNLPRTWQAGKRD